MPSATIFIERPIPRLRIELHEPQPQPPQQFQSQQSQVQQNQLRPLSPASSPSQQITQSPLLTPSSFPGAIMSMTTTTTSTTAVTTTTSNSSSFPKRATFHKIIGSITVILILASMAIVASKSCTEPVATEEEIKSMTSSSGPEAEAPSQASIKTFVKSYYYKLHLLHIFSLSSAFLIVVFSCLDLVPTRDDDIKYAFHFVSVFAIFCISFATLYAAFLAFTRPCNDEKACCSYRTTASLLATTDTKKAITAINSKDVSMSAILVLDIVAGLLQLLVAIVYFRDVRQEATECGYLWRVHNEGYIIR